MKNLMNKTLIGLGVLASTVFFSCSNDDDVDPVIEVTAPVTYDFTRNGTSSVSFGGQTTRIQMAGEFASALKVSTLTEANLNGMFSHIEGGSDFSSEDLNASSKNIRSKVAASQDYFSANSTDAAEIKNKFDSWITSQVTEVFPNWNVDASAGVAGKLQQLSGTTRYINAKGLEYDQAITKSLIGGMMLDQILNNYLSPAKLESGTNLADNNNDVLADGKNYTTMEHNWDEAYGYLYGTEENLAVPAADAADNFLNKYVKRAANNGFTDVPTEIYTAFKLGRAAITAKNYTLRDEQAEIIREKISMTIALRAVHYLQAGKTNLNTDKASAFHGLSEGVGFIYSLQFTRKPGTNAPYFSKSEVEGFINQLTEGNGFWDVTPTTLDQLSETIAAEFEFTVAQAAQ